MRKYNTITTGCIIFQKNILGLNQGRLPQNKNSLIEKPDAG